jgi:ATP-dependent DNA helicase PIF1
MNNNIRQINLANPAMMNPMAIPDPPYNPPLNQYQQKALNATKTGRNVFITGPAGSGKSTLVYKIVQELTNIHGRNVATTALTGCASILLGVPGTKTVHSWAGIGLGEEDTATLTEKIKSIYPLFNRWRSIHTLIIDEISMMPPSLFAKLDQIGRNLRRNQAPFGGIQVILCGDFFQLPPVSAQSTDTASATFVFQTSLWKELALETVLLNKIERQSSDQALQTLLNNIRVGIVDDNINSVIRSRMNLDWKSLAIKPTLLYSCKKDVDMINKSSIQALKLPLRTFNAVCIYRPGYSIKHQFNTYYVKQVLQGFGLETIPPQFRSEEFDINDRTHCCFIINKCKTHMSRKTPISDSAINDLCNHVNKFDKDYQYSPTLELCEGAQVMLITNISIEYGLVNGSRGVIIAFDKTVGYPIVEFVNGRRLTIYPYEWYRPASSADLTADNRPEFRIGRKQLPLVVAYAMTIHKCQGATVDRALVDIGSSIFEYGQAYVALSRVKNLESLYVHDYNPYKIRANKLVVDYYYDLMYPLATPAWNRRKYAVWQFTTKHSN